MTRNVSIRLARSDEQTMLERLQRRASLSNPGDRDALLANPDAIALPLEQIAAGSVFVAERARAVVGFAAVIARPDGGAELDALFLELVGLRFSVGRPPAASARDAGRRSRCLARPCARPRSIRHQGVACERGSRGTGVRGRRRPPTSSPAPGR